jgi:bile acid:Na+ symporter, BASS family
LVAVVTVPVSLALLRPLFPKTITVYPVDVAKVVVTMFLAPLLAGMAVRYVLPTLSGRIRQPLMTATGIIIVGVAVLILALNFSAIVGLGAQGLLIIVLLTIGALAVGHAMGGPDPSDRTTLALACATRLPALAMLIASLNFPNAKPLPVVAAYLLVSNLTALPYLFWRKERRGGDHSKEQPQAAA